MQNKELKLNIPIYRAKKIDSDEYVEGCLVVDSRTAQYYLLEKKEIDVDDHTIFTISVSAKPIEINPSTLAIHFPDMIGSDGTKIFASLSEDGKGGDIVYYKDYLNKDEAYIVKYINMHNEHKIECVGMYTNMLVNDRLKVTGIKE